MQDFYFVCAMLVYVRGMVHNGIRGPKISNDYVNSETNLIKVVLYVSRLVKVLLMVEVCYDATRRLYFRKCPFRPGG